MSACVDSRYVSADSANLVSTLQQEDISRIDNFGLVGTSRGTEIPATTRIRLTASTARGGARTKCSISRLIR
jgi:hypothetical protein